MSDEFKASFQEAVRQLIIEIIKMYLPWNLPKSLWEEYQLRKQDRENRG